VRKPYRYPWPASAITPEDMERLYLLRESSASSIPITELIATAVRQAYGARRSRQPEEHPQPWKESA
jgi:hypothetical protein